MVSKPEALPMEAALCEDGAAQGRIGSEPVSVIILPYIHFMDFVVNFDPND